MICHFDSLTAVNLISGGVNGHHMYAGVIHSIRSLLRKDWEVEVAHTLREANSCVDWLAKGGARDSISMKLWHPSL